MENRGVNQSDSDWPLYEKFRQWDEIDENLHCKSKVKRWAWRHGYSLTFILGLFIITWIVQIVTDYT